MSTTTSSSKTSQSLFAIVLCVFCSALFAIAAQGAEAGKADRKAASLSSPAPENASVYILAPADGERVPRKFKVSFGLSGMGVAPAGVEREHTGHHHLLIDMETLPAMDKPLPASEQLVHFGGGQTETWISLAPGEHTLQLLLGNHFHVPHTPPVLSNKIRVIVE